MFKRLFMLAAAMTVLGATFAQADTFVWKDPTNGYQMSFPDSWTLQTDDGPNTKLRIAGPIGEDMAVCKMEVRKDGRILIYPKRLVDEAVVDKLSRDFWDEQTGELINAKISDYYAPASLGDKGDATGIRVGFVQNDGQGMMVPMYGIMIASLYGDDLYVTSCSSRHDKFTQYAPLFGSIIDSVMLDSRYHIYPTGYYRNFLADPKLVLPRSKPGTIKTGTHFWSNWFTRDNYHYNQ